jgi:hypothetical protein
MNGGTALATRRVPGHEQIEGTQIYANRNDRLVCHLAWCQRPHRPTLASGQDVEDRTEGGTGQSLFTEGFLFFRPLAM